MSCHFYFFQLQGYPALQFPEEVPKSRGHCTNPAHSYNTVWLPEAQHISVITSSMPIYIGGVCVCVCVYKLYPGMKASFIQAQTSNSVILVLTLLEAKSITSHTRSKNFTCSIFLFLLFIKWKQCAEHNINKKSVLCLCLCPRHPEDLAFSNTRCQQCITNSFLFIYSYKFPLCATTAYTQVLSLESRRH